MAEVAFTRIVQTPGSLTQKLLREGTYYKHNLKHLMMHSLLKGLNNSYMLPEIIIRVSVLFCNTICKIVRVAALALLLCKTRCKIIVVVKLILLYYNT